MDAAINKSGLESLLKKAFAKVNHIQAKLNDFPHITKDGEWLTHKEGHWTGGFWAGLLWLESIYSEMSASHRETALAWCKRLAARENDNKTHDMGFIFGPSCVLGYHITAEQELQRLACRGARNMLDLYEPKSGLVLAWAEPGYEGKAIVDTIMNVPILIWASRQLKDQGMYQTACSIADSIAKHHVREDGSIYHMVRWDPTSFEIVDHMTHQGYRADTCWSRGQSWAVYGFANMYRYTKEERYLTTSVQLARYFWDHLDTWWYLPKWDFFFQNDPAEPFDSSAAAIAASGMLLLSAQLAAVKRGEEAKLWEDRGTLLIKSIVMHCLYQSMDKYGIVEGATVDKPRNSGIGESTMYGDYYFTEAIYRLLNARDEGKLELLY